MKTVVLEDNVHAVVRRYRDVIDQPTAVVSEEPFEAMLRTVTMILATITEQTANETGLSYPFIVALSLEMTLRVEEDDNYYIVTLVDPAGNEQCRWLSKNNRTANGWLALVPAVANSRKEM